MKKYIDVIIPRGGKNLVKRVQDLSKVPIIGHLKDCVTHLLIKMLIKSMAIKDYL